MIIKKVCLLTVLMISVSFVRAEKTNQVSLVDIVIMILMDPEYLALNHFEQIKVLDAVYRILGSRLIERINSQPIENNEKL